MKAKRIREGDFIETVEKLIFTVKGLVHPPDRTIAYLRYFKNPLGDRTRNGESYSKVYSFEDQKKILGKRHPEYLFYDKIFGERLQGVPNNQILRVYRPSKIVSNLISRNKLDMIESDAVEFVSLLGDESHIEVSKMGISGSILVGLYTKNSDIDLIVYGKRNCYSVHNTLASQMNDTDSPIKSLNSESLRRLYELRLKGTWMSYKNFVRSETRKKCQGIFKERDFYVRFIKEWNEIDEKYGDRTYVPAGYIKIKAIIENDTDSLFTPCTYQISNVEVVEGPIVEPIREVSSFRGRFCEQAKENEAVTAQGKLEQVIEKNKEPYFRVVLGKKIEDFMISESA